MTSMKRKKEKAGVVVYRFDDSAEPLVLVVSARKYKGQWVFPVGSVEAGESLEQAAKRECREESGYTVTIGAKLPAVQVEDDARIKRFTFFLATLVGETDEWESDRERKWIPASQVADALPDIFKPVARNAIQSLP